MYLVDPSVIVKPSNRYHPCKKPQPGQHRTQDKLSNLQDSTPTAPRQMLRTFLLPFAMDPRERSPVLDEATHQSFLTI